MSYVSGRVLCASTVLVVCGSFVSTAHAHPYGWRVGQTIDGDLTVDFLWQQLHLLDDQLVGYAGFADRGLAFEEFPVANPTLNLYPLSSGGKIELVVSEFATGLYLRDQNDVPNARYLPGDSWSIGSSGTGFMTHPWWHLDTTTPGFDAQAGIWTAQFYLRDISGVHGDSEVYTFRVRIPAPGSIATMGVLGLMASRRRR
jgi:hypothetical protein